MIVPGRAHKVAPGQGQAVDLGIVRMRVLAAGEDTTKRAFTLVEFAGGEGPWTVPHLHGGMEESFFVLDGEFTFTVGEQEIPVGAGSYLLVPRRTEEHPRHRQVRRGRAHTAMS